MGYAPPSGNAVNFDFNTPGYSPPTGNAVPFPFGAGPSPPGGAGLPTLRYRLLFGERSWFPTMARRFAPPIAAAAPVPPFMRAQRPWLFPDEWHPTVALGRRFAPPPSPPAAIVRPVLFVIT